MKREPSVPQYIAGACLVGALVAGVVARGRAGPLTTTTVSLFVMLL
jgi:hypothetical protein